MEEQKQQQYQQQQEDFEIHSEDRYDAQFNYQHQQQLSSQQQQQQSSQVEDGLKRELLLLDDEIENLKQKLSKAARQKSQSILSEVLETSFKKM